MATQHVLMRANPELLDALHTVCSNATSRTYPEWCNSTDKDAAERASNIALASGEVVDPEIVARFIALRQASGHGLFRHAGWDKVPTPVLLLVDAIRSGLYAASQDNGGSIPVHRIISTDFLLKLIRAAGGDITDLFFVLFKGRGYNAEPDLTLAHWRESERLGELARAAPDSFATAALRIGGVNLGALLDAARNIGIDGTPAMRALLVALLGKGQGKIERQHGVRSLALLAEADLHALVTEGFATGDIETRHGLVEAAGRNGGASLLALLVELGAKERAGKVKAAIATCIESANARTEPASLAGVATPGYPAIDGRFIAIPPLCLPPAEPVPPATAPERDAYLAIIAAIQADKATKLAAISGPGHRDYASNLPLQAEQIEATFALLTEGRAQRSELVADVNNWVRANDQGIAWFTAILDNRPLGVAARVVLASSFNVLDSIARGRRLYDYQEFGVDRILGWIESGQLGLRELYAIEDEIALCRAKPGEQPQAISSGQALLHALMIQQNSWHSDPLLPRSFTSLPRDAVWPLIADNFALLDEAFGLVSSEQASPLSSSRAMALLALLPAVPRRYLPRLLELGLTGKRAEQQAAMALLHSASDLDSRLAAALDDSRQHVRAAAAKWLADIRATGSEAALRKRLNQEKSDPVRAALIISLQRMGFNLSDVIGPAVLIAAAEAAGAKATAALPAWLIAHSLPVPHFRDGSTVPPLVVRHWLALAIRLKDPAASGQFGIYLDQLRDEDARMVSNWVLDSWISFDTRTPSQEEATAFAKAVYGNLVVYDGSKAVRGSELPSDQQAVLIANIAREKANELVNSGAETKGLLALACRADPVWAANRVRWFLKKHARRTSQAVALFEVMAGIGQPATLQVVIAASVRSKQKGTQARAAEIAARYAEDRGWSVTDLADRTVPTAGFDDDGVLELPCGEDGKLYTARLDAMLAIHVFNPDGKAVKGLPGGDDEATREAKKAFSAAKKELAQVIDLQGSRLFEAMCVERAWPVDDWRLAFHDHRVMRRLIERLVWQGLDDNGDPLGLFRPTQEGDFTDAEDNPVAIDDFAKVRLAHGALVDAATCAAWSAHLTDYEIKPFLAQFDAVRAPLTDDAREAEAIFDRQGWKADSMTYRGLSEKRGYQRVTGDGGGCNEYAKTFPSHGITATIRHTGSYAVDENNAVALKELRFAKEGHRGTFRLKDVPPVMLAECRADYHAIAAKGAFDPEWKSISPW